MPTQEDLQDFIDTVGYTEVWFALDFLPLSFVERQREEFKTGEDTHVEHYKWAGYSYVLEHEDFSDLKRLRQFMQLIQEDPNEHLPKGALAGLIRAGLLTRDNYKEVGLGIYEQDPLIRRKLNLS
ncbi:MAG TPA: hypothetical protein DCE41_35725 [Cytophagales bacterium]|nr:hypothetical protein [Cytophagales bacterium]HAP63002.1 hypothetical protein [Cytophagales bacterium]